MSRGERIYFLVCAAAIGFALGYALPVYAHLRRHYYDPIHHLWLWTNNAGPVPMGYYGQQLWGLTGALLAGGVAALITRFRGPASERAQMLWAAWALSTLAIVVGYFTWNNWP